MRVTLEAGQFGWDYILRAEDGRTVLIQTDWDYPGTASNLGWSPCHDGTDGTVDCPCGKSAMDLISDAKSFLDDHEGESFEDPGYFPDEGKAGPVRTVFRSVGDVPRKPKRHTAHEVRAWLAVRLRDNQE